MSHRTSISFRDLDVYKRTMVEANLLYRRTERFPYEERFGLTNQVRRSSSSVSAHIAEAWPRRGYRGAFAHTLRRAAGEVCETQCWLEHARNRGYISADEYEAMNKSWEVINAMIYSMIAKRDRFAF